MKPGKYITRFSSIIFLLLWVFFIPSGMAANLYGVTGGSGPDSGKLIRSRTPHTDTSSWYDVGNTGLQNLSALAFDPFEQKLIAGKSTGALYVLNKDTAAPTKIVDRLIYDSELPPEIPELAGKFNSLIFFLTSLDFDPTTPGMLYGVIRDNWGTDLLVRLNLAAIDNLELEVDVIGIIGSNNLAITGNRFGYTNAQISFNPSTGELFGTGLKFDSAFPYFIALSKTPASIGNFAFELQQAGLIRSFPKAMAADLNGDQIFTVGLSDTFSSGTLMDTLFRFSAPNGWLDIPMHLMPEQGIEGLAMGTDFPFAPPRQPIISDFYPKGGNAGIQVTIEGEGFTAWGDANIKEVYFNNYPAYSPARVISDNKLVVTVPNTQTGPIKVVLLTDSDYNGSDDEVDSSIPFVRSHLRVYETEINQGIPSQPLIYGKDTLIRLLTYSDGSSTSEPMPVTFGTATLTITKPSGEEVLISPTQYTRIFSNPQSNGLEPSHRHNINFYLSGDELNENGIYQYSVQVKAYTPDAIPANIIYTARGTLELTGSIRFTHIPVLVVLGGIQNGGVFTGPDEGSMSGIFKVFDEMSRVFPVQNGVSRLGDDLTAGVRFDIASSAIVLGDSLASFRISEADFNGLEGYMTGLLDEYNQTNSDPARFAALFVADEFTTGGVTGRGQYPGNISIAKVPDAADGMTSKSALHELGHNFYLVYEDSPNKDPDDVYHSLHNEFPENSDPRQIRAFNVPGRTNIEDYAGITILPRSIMVTGTGGIPDGQFFFENREYIDLIYPPVIEITGEADWPFDSTMSLSVEVNHDGTANILNSYMSAVDKPFSIISPSSPYSLVFLDASSRVLIEDHFPVSFYLGDGDHTGTQSSTKVVSLVRPMPNNTVQIQVRKSEQVLATVERTNEGPNVSILFPSGGEVLGPDEEVILSWQATDPDNDSLRSSISYSPDGGNHWIPIAAGIDATSIPWRTTYAAGTSEGMIRVTVSDGFNTAIATSNTFTVATKPPVISILHPKDGQIFQQYDSIVLEAMAYDLESGVLQGSALTWSSVYGTLGRGRKVILEPGVLSPAATQPVTLTATDGETSVSKSVSITILADTDRDGLSDAFENQYSSQDPQNPYDAGRDIDEDGLTSLQEATFGTNPENADTDGDGYTDSAELSSGSNPNDSESTPAPVFDLNRYRFALSIHLGQNTPLGNFNNQTDPDTLSELDFEYRPSLKYSYNGVLGQYNFDPDYTITGATLYLRRYQQLTPQTESYTEGGLGIYDPDNLSTALGFSLGIGISRPITPTIRSEVGANYFHLFNTGDDIEFFGLKAGIRYTF